eukprot:Gb_36168 [translate_table: standard]
MDALAFPLCIEPTQPDRGSSVFRKRALLSFRLPSGFNATIKTLARGNNDYCGTVQQVRRLCKEGRLKEALTIFPHLDRQEVCADVCTYTRLLQGCIQRKALAEGKQLHAFMNKLGFKPDVVLQNQLLNMYVKCGNVEDARRVFDKMTERNVVSWNAMIAGYVQIEHFEKAVALFYQMQLIGMNPSRYTLVSILSSCANLSTLEQGKEIHGHVVKAGFVSNVFVESALVDMYAKCGIMDYARKVFDRMFERNSVSWNVMIAGYARNEQFEEALKFFRRMEWEGMKPDEFTFGSILSACADLLVPKTGKEIHARMIKSTFASDIFALCALVNMYAKCGGIEDARNVFDRMSNRDLVSWNAMLAGYAYQGPVEEALEFFQQMECGGIKPDQFTFVSVLCASANIAALEHGKQVHANIIKTGFEFVLCVGNALVDMYAKCGSIESAQKTFDKMHKQNVVSWNAIISGCAQHGRGKEALQLFEQMQWASVKPDHITFIGILSACSHVGLLDEGRHYFDSMTHDHGITPGLEHYTCIFDLLGRAGRLDEAEDLINCMPFEPDVLVWRTLLGACRIHGNEELGKRAAECVLELEPQSPSTYVLLSNIYAAAGRWNDVTKVRNMMKERGVRKEPGQSWIFVKGKVHTFMARDISHPHAEEIYSKLEELT